MIKTTEINEAIERKQAGDIPRMINAREFLPFQGEYVPVVLPDGEVARGALWLQASGELMWQITGMNFGPVERQMPLKAVFWWLG